MNIDATIKDALSFASDHFSRMICSMYVYSVRVPQIFHGIYKFGEMEPKFNIKSFVYNANRIYERRLYKYLQQESYDAIVTTHLFPSETLTSLKKRGKCPQKTVAVATDYTCQRLWAETNMDYYIVPQEEFHKDFVKNGVPEHKLRNYGIPVSKRFAQSISKEEAREILQLPQDRNIYLIMSGSMGYGNLGSLVEELLLQGGEKAYIVLICGRNEALKERLGMRFGANPSVEILGYTTQISEFMDAANVLFTKPGGLTTTEAAVKGIPLIHTQPIPGYETSNALFFSSKRMSYYSEDQTQQAKMALRLCEDALLRKTMLEAQATHIKKDSAHRIAQLVASLA